MKKLTLMLILVFSAVTVNSFAADKDKGKKEKCIAGNECCKDKGLSTAAKAKCAKKCAAETKGKKG